mmetsp:Transcript_10228/g.22186  ORF Transcript_10228/g.22186 Transcript_10228/m.22186 type:complete len:218 (+) Transcript_10228:389-1042(+)
MPAAVAARATSGRDVVGRRAASDGLVGTAVQVATVRRGVLCTDCAAGGEGRGGGRRVMSAWSRRPRISCSTTSALRSLPSSSHRRASSMVAIPVKTSAASVPARCPKTMSDHMSPTMSARFAASCSSFRIVCSTYGDGFAVTDTSSMSNCVDVHRACRKAPFPGRRRPASGNWKSRFVASSRQLGFSRRQRVAYARWKYEKPASKPTMTVSTSWSIG